MLRSIRFAPIIEDTAHTIVSILRRLKLGYVALHLRLDEFDNTAFATSKNTSKNLLRLITEAKDRGGSIAQDNALVYVASGNQETSLLHTLPWQATRKELLLPVILETMSRIPEMLGAIDFIVAEYSYHFIGFSQSTFSCLLYLRRKFLNLSSTFYDGNRPPWQITLSLDPLEQSFSMLKTSRKDCNAFQSGQRAECMFVN